MSVCVCVSKNNWSYVIFVFAKMAAILNWVKSYMKQTDLHDRPP